MTYVPLRVRSNYTFLEGASHPEELVQRAADLGLDALALTDRGGVYGLVRAHVAAKEVGLKLLAGAEITVEGGGALLLLAPDLEAWGDLCELLTLGRRAAPKGQCRLSRADVLAWSARLLAVTVGPVAEDAAHAWARAFGERLSLGVARTYAADDEAVLQATLDLARRLGVSPVVAPLVALHDPERKALADVLTCIRLGTTLPEAGRRLDPNAERRLHPPREVARRYADLPAALERTRELAARCTFSLDELRYRYPSELVPPGHTPMGWLRHRVAEGARLHYPDGVPPSVAAQLQHELGLIDKLGYPNYFLTMDEIVAFARSRGILCQGRGSAANSAVCFVLGVTSVDPARSNLLFERFLSEERDEPPDIDVDFEHERREEVIQHIYDKYGRDRAGMVAEVIRYRGRSAVRDVGKALGLPLDLVDRMARSLGHWSAFEDLEDGRLAESGVDPADASVQLLVRLVREIRYFPRHLSIHVGGFVLSDSRLTRLVPVENASMEGRTVIQWDKLDVEAAGLLKIDVLALGMLSCIRKTFELLEAHDGLPLTLATIPAEDPDTYRMIRAADTIGTFQIESRAQMTMLPRLQPERFYDLVIEVAIMRPGPIQGRMVHPYLRRRHGQEPVVYPHPSAVPVLERTCGVPLFQEQVMQLAVVAAGFTPGEADQLRRAMGTWRSQGKMRLLRQKLCDGMRANGIADEFADRVIEQIEGFGDYGFPESHAASFAILAYASAWLKRHHVAAFTTALLNSQPMGFYQPATLVRDAQAHGVEVRPVHVAASAWDCTLEPATLAPVPRGRDLPFSVADQSRWALRLGLRQVRGLRREVADALVAARAERPFGSLDDLLARVPMPADAPFRLAAVGALDGLGACKAVDDDEAERRARRGENPTGRLPALLPGGGPPDPHGGIRDRRDALWRVQGLPLPRGDLLDGAPLPEPVVRFPAMTPVETLTADYEGLGLSVDLHPIEPLRPQLQARGVTPSCDLLRLPDRKRVTVAGLVTVRQGPVTAKGLKFLTLEDEHGQTNVVIFPDVYQQNRALVRTARLLLVEGPLEREGRVIHVRAQRLVELRLADDRLRASSRDFY